MKTKHIVGLLLASGAVAYLYYGYKPIWQFDHLEQNARKVITAAELQTWATNLIALHPTNVQMDFRISELGTNFPHQLLGLAPRFGPGVTVYQWAGTNDLPFVRIWWGSGVMGRAGFQIGPFMPGPDQEHQWAEGVYFFKL